MLFYNRFISTLGALGEIVFVFPRRWRPTFHSCSYSFMFFTNMGGAPGDSKKETKKASGRDFPKLRQEVYFDNRLTNDDTSF